MKGRKGSNRSICKLLMTLIVMVVVSFFGTRRDVVHAESYHNYYIYDSTMVSALKNWNSESYHLGFQNGTNVEATTKTSSGKSVYGIATSLNKPYKFGIKLHYGNRTQSWTEGLYMCDTTIGDSQLSYIRTGEYSFTVIVGDSKLIVRNGKKTYTTPTKYSCSFNTNGVGKMATSSFVEGRVINLASYIPESKHHLVFAGWYTDPEFQNKVNFVSLRKSITLYAKWLIPKTVRGLRVKSSDGKMKIRWSKKDSTLKKFGIKGYQLRITTAHNFSNILVDMILKKGKKSFNIAMAPGTYYVWIRYCSGAVVSDWEVTAVSVTSFYESVTRAQAPKLKKAKAHKSKVHITWKKPSRAEIKKYTITGYEVQYSKDRGFGSEVAAKVLKKGKSSYTFKGQQSTKYYVRIRYVGAGGASPWSAVKEVTTKK